MVLGVHPLVLSVLWEHLRGTSGTIGTCGTYHGTFGTCGTSFGTFGTWGTSFGTFGTWGTLGTCPFL